MPRGVDDAVVRGDVVSDSIVVRELGVTGYAATLQRMQAFTSARTESTRDELWLLQHYPVYTQGLSCTTQPRGDAGIEVVHSDRGGQITYHGPGQLVVYPLIDLRRRNIGVKAMVRLLEQAVIDYLAASGIVGERVVGAPGVYVNGKKIAALGLRVRRGATYHGLSFNVNMDLSPFTFIDPCGYRNLTCTQLKDLGAERSVEQVQSDLATRIIELLDR